MPVPTKGIEKTILKNLPKEQLIEKLASINRKTDIIYFSKESKNKLNDNTYSYDKDSFRSETDKENNDMMVDRYKELLLNQKFYVLAKAILLSDNAKDQYVARQAKEMYKMTDITNASVAVIAGGEGQLSKEEIEFQKECILLAKTLKNEPSLHGFYSTKDDFEEVINNAEKKDPDFLKNAFNLVGIKEMLPTTNQQFINDDFENLPQSKMSTLKECYISTKELKKMTDAYQVGKEEKEFKAADVDEAMNIRQMQQERNSKPGYWFYLRPISNLVNYIKLNSAKSKYKSDFIDKKIQKNPELKKEDLERNFDNFINGEKLEVAKENVGEYLLSGKTSIDSKEQNLLKDGLGDLTSDNKGKVVGKVQDEKDLSLTNENNKVQEKVIE